MTSCPDPAAANNEITPMNSTGGASIPPTAHSIGTAAALGLDSDPVVSSCFNSRPTVRKNTVSRPSCTQWPNPMSNGYTEVLKLFERMRGERQIGEQ